MSNHGNGSFTGRGDFTLSQQTARAGHRRIRLTGILKWPIDPALLVEE
jgi:hypothetical protein